MEYFKIGKIVATYGVEGKMILKHSLGRKYNFNNTKALFLEDRNDSLLPWFIQNSQARNNEETLVQLEGIVSKETATKFLQKEIWLTEEDFHALAASGTPISLLGFQIIHQGVSIGTISEVVEQPHQTLCKVVIDGKDAWIPLHEASLKQISKSKKQVIVELPDGLLEVYKNS